MTEKVAILEIAKCAMVPTMGAMDSLPQWLDEELKKPGRKASELARRLHVGPDKVSKMRKGLRGIKATELPVIEAYLGSKAPIEVTGLGGLREEGLAYWEPEPSAEPTTQTVKVVGYVGAGSEAHFYPAGDLDEVPAPDGATADTVAVEVRGESMGALYDRWLVFYDDVRRPATDDLIGRICVVGLEDGRVLVKKLRRGRHRGLFTLISENGEPINDVPIEWAARVKLMAPRS